MHPIQGNLTGDTSAYTLTKTNTQKAHQRLQQTHCLDPRSREFLLFAFPHQKKLVASTVNSHSPELFLEGEGVGSKKGRVRGDGEDKSVENFWSVDQIELEEGGLLSVTTRWRSQPQPPPVTILGVRTASSFPLPGEPTPNLDPGKLASGFAQEICFLGCFFVLRAAEKRRANFHSSTH